MILMLRRGCQSQIQGKDHYVCRHTIIMCADDVVKHTISDYSKGMTILCLCVINMLIINIDLEIARNTREVTHRNINNRTLGSSIHYSLVEDKRCMEIYRGLATTFSHASQTPIVRYNAVISRKEFSESKNRIARLLNLL